MAARSRSKEIGGKLYRWWHVPFNAVYNVNLTVVAC